MLMSNSNNKQLSYKDAGSMLVSLRFNIEFTRKTEENGQQDKKKNDGTKDARMRRQ